jgi:hypothetical protein
MLPRDGGIATRNRRPGLFGTLRGAYGRAAGAREEVRQDLTRPGLFRLWPALVIGLALLATVGWGLFLAYAAFSGLAWLWRLVAG